jgi:hypothetical protein
MYLVTPTTSDLFRVLYGGIGLVNCQNDNFETFIWRGYQYQQDRKSCLIFWIFIKAPYHNNDIESPNNDTIIDYSKSKGNLSIYIDLRWPKLYIIRISSGHFEGY